MHCLHTAWSYQYNFAFPKIYPIDGDIWVKKASKGGFDVPQESYDDAEISELIGISV